MVKFNVEHNARKWNEWQKNMLNKLRKIRLRHFQFRIVFLPRNQTHRNDKETVDDGEQGNRG